MKQNNKQTDYEKKVFIFATFLWAVLLVLISFFYIQII
jgi:hypothetical protein